MSDERPIGVFDSGLGGLTVLRAVAARLPAERLVYLGDTARVPYGTKSAATVSRYARQCADFLCGRGIKALVVACNTASALAIEAPAGDGGTGGRGGSSGSGAAAGAAAAPGLRAALEPRGIPVLGVIEPGAVEACRVSRSGHVGVIGTASTIRSGAYTRAIGAIRPDFTVDSAACPLFVPLAEEGWTAGDDAVARAAAMRYLEPLRARGIDTLILGCTHYPLLREVIAGALPGVALVDSGAAVAGDLARALERLGIAAADQPGGGRPAATRQADYYVTDDPERFRDVGARFLGHDIEGPHLADLTADTPPPGLAGDGARAAGEI